MKRFTSTRLFAIVCMIVMGFVQTWAQTVNKPTITPGTKDSDGNYTCDFDGSIGVTIQADEGCTIIYKWGSTASTSEALQISSTATHVDNNVATTTKHYTISRVLSAIAVKTENGTTTYSEATIAKFNYVADAKKTLTLTASSFNVNIGVTEQIKVTAKDGDTEVTGLDYTYESDNPSIATVDANGVVKGIASGNCYITISFAGNNTYKDATTSINIGVNSAVTSYANGTIFTNIADVRHAGQLIPDGDKTTYKWVLDFTKGNTATVVGVLNVDDPDLGEGANSVFIVDNTGRGLWIPSSREENKTFINNLKVGDVITGTLVGTFKQRTQLLPEFTRLDYKINGYSTKLNINTSGETANEGKPLYPVNEITDVNTLAEKLSDGSIVTSSYGIYLNTIVSVPGTIRLGAAGQYYLMQDEQQTDISTTNENNRLNINTTQIGKNITDYVNTSGVFEGILIKRSNSLPKLVVLKDNFFQINKIYLDENDDENRIDDLVNAGAFDDEVDVYVHRTKLVNTTANAWNTLCFPFDLSAEEFNTAFGCTLSALAKPKVNTEETINGRLTKIGEVDSNNNLLFNTVEDLSIEEGIPYLMKAEGTQKYGINPSTNISIKDKTPQELIDAEPNYYAHIGQKRITVVPPHQIQGEINNKIVGGKFYLRGLYGSKQYANNADGSLSTTTVADNGSQKYQYISTSEHNYLKYLKKDATAKFPGFRAYFYFPYWSSVENNKAQANPANNTINAKVFLLVDDSTTGISDIRTDENHNDGRIYNLAGQVVDASYKGIIIKNGRKYLAK